MSDHCGKKSKTKLWQFSWCLHLKTNNYYLYSLLKLVLWFFATLIFGQITVENIKKLCFTTNFFEAFHQLFCLTLTKISLLLSNMSWIYAQNFMPNDYKEIFHHVKKKIVSKNLLVSQWILDRGGFLRMREFVDICDFAEKLVAKWISFIEILTQAGA